VLEGEHQPGLTRAAPTQAPAQRGSFTHKLRQLADPIWQAQHDHPFVRGIADGSLEPNRFRWYLRQDYVYLKDYARLLAMGAARAPTVDLMTRLATIAQATLTSEMDLHRSHCTEWGISPGELEREQAAPATRAYGNYLLKTATLGDFAEFVGALLPCLWGYQEIGERLAHGPRPPHALYARWIDAYAGDEYAELVTFGQAACEDAAADLSERGRKRVRTSFITSSQYELEFWEAAWQAQAFS
jgi:thiaminase/transcriptional activator TenA